MALPVTEDPRKCFGSANFKDGTRDYASRDTWSNELCQVVKGLEDLYMVDDYQPPSLRKMGDAPEPSRVYLSPVPEISGFGQNRACGTGWGFPEDIQPR